MRKWIPKIIKRNVRNALFTACEQMEASSFWIQRHVLHSTVEEERSERNLALPLAEMDDDLLATYIRWNGHHVEKAVRYRRDPASQRGLEPAELLRRALREWNRRGLPRRAFVCWAEENLSDFERWLATCEPQFHPEKDLPVFRPDAPVWDVLVNRVSTRFWQPLPVEEEKIQRVLEAAVYAPTACNRQAWKLYVKRNRPETNTVTSGVSNTVLRKKAPVAIYITIDNRLYPEIYAPAEDAGIIGLQISLAATSLGLGGCLMYGAENFPQEEFRQDFNVPEHRYMYLMYLFGYPAERTLTCKRADPEDIAIFA